MRRWVGKYECDGCGACCVHLVPSINEDDIRREPRLELHMLDDERYMDFGEKGTACPFLTEGGDCEIYVNRPHCCSIFPPGSELCQYARGRAGLGFLQPVDWTDTWNDNHQNAI